MKKQIIRIITLLAFSSVLLSSCSMEYRERRRTHNQGGRHDNDRDHNHDDHHYNRY